MKKLEIHFHGRIILGESHVKIDFHVWSKFRPYKSLISKFEIIWKKKVKLRLS